jgi:transcriptional regulator with XRE-family HTH domain
MASIAPRTTDGLPQTSEELTAIIQARLRTLRTHLCLTQPEMAHRLGMSVRTYRAWEHRPRSTRGWTRMLFSLSDEFGVSIDWMVGGGYPGQPRNDNLPMARGGTPLPRPTRH